MFSKIRSFVKVIKKHMSKSEDDKWVTFNISNKDRRYRRHIGNAIITFINRAGVFTTNTISIKIDEKDIYLTRKELKYLEKSAKKMFKRYNNKVSKEKTNKEKFERKVERNLIKKFLKKESGGDEIL